MDANALYYGDTLDILGRHVADESVDLVSRITSAMRFDLEAATRDEPRSACVGSGRCIHGLNAVVCEACFDGNDRRQGMSGSGGDRSPDFSESWLHDRISDDPSVLGLGELDVLERERVQRGGGRLDMLLTDGESNARFAVAIMPGCDRPAPHRTLHRIVGHRTATLPRVRSCRRCLSLRILRVAFST